jgi:hypothetical protein
VNLGMREVGDGRNLLVQPYPIVLAQRAFHRPRHRQRSSQTRLAHRPVSPKELVYAPVNHPVAVCLWQRAIGGCGRRCGNGKAA